MVGHLTHKRVTEEFYSMNFGEFYKQAQEAAAKRRCDLDSATIISYDNYICLDFWVPLTPEELEDRRKRREEEKINDERESRALYEELKLKYEKPNAQAAA